MSLKVKNIHSIMEKHAPARLKQSYDNVGLMVGDMNSEVSSILIALDCTMDVVEEAKKKGCNLIFTHHPLLFKKPSNITTDTLLGRKIIELIRNDISLYSSHTNLDAVKGGINDIIMNLLGMDKCKIIEPIEGTSGNEEGSGIGRIAELKEVITLDQFCDRIKKALNISVLRYAGPESKKITKVAVINGSGQDYFSAAKKMGADCVITGDTTYHYVSDFQEEGIAIIDAGHFGTEWPAMTLVAEYLKKQIEDMGFNSTIILSETSRNPYKYK
ncbi:Nif3-like dinuclear metal center hexameric protein [Clostridium sp. A1-XYC3]|uniref:GTP cyclohydrolase 1 type 2 homolog n=1 Tax=Clostridium tanneri TaxID=3037988 RepID=A0ABU4JNS8_9CLOT|nr:Nif3-like dinuclear metal center hexameric protein [Clostridium sp. A1-XYC3]MDW8799796.1 Nif3-like dinuclear metal center hexameric protein [Clostridium sp. A1-XYC3]